MLTEQESNPAQNIQLPGSLGFPAHETDYEVLEFNSFVMFLLNISLFWFCNEVKIKQVSTGSSVLIAYTVHKVSSSDTWHCMAIFPEKF